MNAIDLYEAMHLRVCKIREAYIIRDTPQVERVLPMTAKELDSIPHLNYIELMSDKTYLGMQVEIVPDVDGYDEGLEL